VIAVTDDVRHRLLAAGRELAGRLGWNQVRMGQVAQSAGVSRQTVYNAFGTKDGLAQAIVAAELHHFVQGVAERLHSRADLRAGAQAAIGWALAEASHSSLLTAIVLGVPADGLLPYVTTRSALVRAALSERVAAWTSTIQPALPRPRVEFAADAIVRLTLSHVLSPASDPDVSRHLADAYVLMLATPGDN
jgi:AcrR family transcriptional regulator